MPARHCAPVRKHVVGRPVEGWTMMFVTTGRPVDFVIDRRRDHDSGVTVLRDCAPC